MSLEYNFGGRPQNLWEVSDSLHAQGIEQTTIRALEKCMCIANS